MDMSDTSRAKTVRKNSLVNQQRGTGGPTKVPDCDVAEMRFLRERKGMIIADIVRYFEDEYSPKYVKDVCNYTIRAKIQPRDPNAET